MVKNFSNKFGNPEKTIFVMGDYDKRRLPYERIRTCYL